MQFFEVARRGPAIQSREGTISVRAWRAGEPQPHVRTIFRRPSQSRTPCPSAIRCSTRRTRAAADWRREAPAGVFACCTCRPTAMSNKRAVVEQLRSRTSAHDKHLPGICSSRQQFDARIVRADVDPIELILGHDVVERLFGRDLRCARRAVSVLVVDDLNEQSGDLRRLSDEDSRADIGDLVAA